MFRGIAVALLAALVLAAPAGATFPGENGLIGVAFSQSGAIHRQMVVNPDGTGLREFGEPTDTGVSWSPDGRQIAFYNTATSPWELWVAHSDGSSRRKVATPEPDPDLHPVWAPDGRHIAVDRFFGGPITIFDLQGDSWTINPEPGPPFVAWEEPDWSPDGETFAAGGRTEHFLCNPNDDTDCFFEYRVDLYLVKADGSGSTRLTSDALNGTDSASPSWSPDGKRIAVESGLGIHVIDADGSNRRPLVARGQIPVWSPDGTKIAFWDNWDIFTVNVDGTGLVKILDGGSFGDPQYCCPEWQTVVPNHPPDCSGVTATPNVLWPPNGRLRKVTLSGATDPDGDTVTLVATSVTLDERAGRRPQFRLNGDSTVLLRAKRKPSGDGRVYTVGFEVTDEHDATCTGTTTVSVPERKHGNRPRHDD